MWCVFFDFVLEGDEGFVMVVGVGRGLLVCVLLCVFECVNRNIKVCVVEKNLNVVVML